MTGAGEPACGSQNQRDTGARQGGGEQSLLERLEEWRRRPELCLVWAALCTSSPLTLADGVALAKTNRSCGKALRLLSGVGSADLPESCMAQQLQDAAKQDAGKSEPGSKGLGKKEPSKNEPVRKELGKKGPSRSEPGKKDASKREPNPPTLEDEEDDDREPPHFEPPARRLQLSGLGARGDPHSTPRRAGCEPRPPRAEEQVAKGLSSPRSRLPVEAFTPLKSDSRPVGLVAETPPKVAPAEAAARPAKEAARKHPQAQHLCDARDSNLAFFRVCFQFGFEPWAEGDFSRVGVVGKSVHGDVLHVTALNDGTDAVAKVVPNEEVEAARGRESNERRSWANEGEATVVDDLRTEIAVLTRLQSMERCPHLIRLLGIFQDAESTYLLTERCEGGDLFERVVGGGELGPDERRRCARQLLLAARHLHSHNIGHRDISLENVLLRNGDCVLMDFGQAVRLRAMDGTVLRYFAEAGKRMYRAPEMFVPREHSVKVVCPSDGAPGASAQVFYDSLRCEVLLPPDAKPGQPCMAEPYGYAAAPADVLACGVCAFVLAVGKPPWGVAQDTDLTFSFIRRHGVPMLLHQWRGGRLGPLTEPPDEETSLLAEMLRVDPKRRPTVEDCLHSPWIAPTAVAKARRTIGESVMAMECH